MALTSLKFSSVKFREAMQGRPGPVVVALPEDMLDDVVAVSDAPRVVPAAPAPSGDDVERLRAMLAEALSGRLTDAEFRTDPNFGFSVPVAIEGVEAAILNPRGTWDDPAAYDAQARKLVAMFKANFAKFDTHVDEGVRAAAPGILAAA